MTWGEPIIVHCLARDNSVVLPIQTDEKFVVNALNPTIVRDFEGRIIGTLNPGERMKFELIEARWWEFWRPAIYWKGTKLDVRST